MQLNKEEDINYKSIILLLFNFFFYREEDLAKGEQQLEDD